MLPLIALLIFASVALVAFEFMRPKADPVSRRILPPGQTGRAAAAPRHTREEGIGKRVIGPGLTRAGTLLSRVLPANWVRGVNRKLVMADEPWSLPGFLGVWALATVLASGVLYYLVRSIQGITAL